MSDRAPAEPLDPTLVSEPGVDSTLRSVGSTLGSEEGSAATGEISGLRDDADRYRTSAVLGVGGMGEVRLCRDEVIGRDVALKRMLPDVRGRSRAQARFAREALVQARLEHPSIVPVYDVALSDPEGPWFTMKRIRGRSLESTLQAAREGDTEGTPSRRRLLTAFVQVCLAVDYAHRRGVVHRDLKPANVMLGEFGEVHLLDWGLAKIVGETPREVSLELGSSEEDATLAGSLMGTPGYMAPEQARGAVDEIGPATDVYALGAILFELLTLTPLHEEQSPIALLSSTMAGVPPSRFDDPALPPELAGLCARATATAPTDRLSSARALADAVERYLDGDRDLQLRARLAHEHFERAQQHIASEGALGEAARAHALRELGRTVALDPTNAPALDLMTHLLVEPTDTVPPEVEPELERARVEERRTAFRQVSRRFLLWCVFIAGMVSMGVVNAPVAAAIAVLVIASSALAALAARQARPTSLHGAILLATTTLPIALSAGVLGPFIIAPGLAATNTLFFALHASPRQRPWVVAVGALAIVVPFALDIAGITPPAYVYGDQGLTIVERVLRLPEVATNVNVLLISTLVVIVPTIMVAQSRDALARAERRLVLQAWRLRQMLPQGTRDLLARGSSGPRGSTGQRGSTEHAG